MGSLWQSTGAAHTEKMEGKCLMACLCRSSANTLPGNPAPQQAAKSMWDKHLGSTSSVTALPGPSSEYRHWSFKRCTRSQWGWRFFLHLNKIWALESMKIVLSLVKAWSESYKSPLRGAWKKLQCHTEHWQHTIAMHFFEKPRQEWVPCSWALHKPHSCSAPCPELCFSPPDPLGTHLFSSQPAST